MNTMQPYRYTWKQSTYTGDGVAWIEHCVPYDPRLEEYKDLHQDVADWADDSKIRCFMPLYINPIDWIEDSKGDVLVAFDKYARQFTYNNHPAEPSHFPKSYPWFEAGYCAGLNATIDKPSMSGSVTEAIESGYTINMSVC